MIPSAGIPVNPSIDEYTHWGYDSGMKSEAIKVDEMTATATDLLTDSNDGPRRSTSYAADKERILNRLRRMEGQVGGVD